jgi:hypothetical protein
MHFHNARHMGLGELFFRVGTSAVTIPYENGESVHLSEMGAESGAFCRCFLTLNRGLIMNPCPSCGAKFGPTLNFAQGARFGSMPCPPPPLSWVHCPATASWTTHLY